VIRVFIKLKETFCVIFVLVYLNMIVAKINLILEMLDIFCFWKIMLVNLSILI